MTDNEQGYTPTTEEVSHRWVTYPHTPTRPMQQVKREEFDRWLAATLAAHRVTLVADSREALAKGIEAGWANPKWDGVTLRPIDRQIADHLLASGVVQVTTPTETDEVVAEIDLPSGPDFAARRAIKNAQMHVSGAGLTMQYDDMVAMIVDGITLASRPAPVAPPTEETDPLGPKSPDDCTHWKVGRSFGSTHGVCHSCGSQIEYDEVSPLSIIEVKPPVVPVDALGFPTQEGATFTATFSMAVTRIPFVVVGSETYESRYSGEHYRSNDLDHTSIEDVRPADGRGGQ